MSRPNFTPLKHAASVVGRIGWHGLSTADYTTVGDLLVTGTDLVEGAVTWDRCHRVSPDIWARDPRIHLQAGDVLLTKDGTIGKVAVVDTLPGRATLNSGVFRIVPNRLVLSPRYCYWTLTSKLFTDFVDLLGSGSTINHLYQADVVNFALPLPPLRVQQAIAGYLDRETARIDALIAAKRRMVALLEERRKASRDEAFASKPGWRLKRLLSASMAYGVLVPEFVEPGTGVPMIRTYNLLPRGRVSHEDIAEIPATLAHEYQRTSLRKGDVILSVVGSMGRAAVATDDEHGFNLNRPLARIQLRSDVPPRLIWHWTQTTHFIDMAKLATGGGTAQPTLNLGDLANFGVGLPRAPERWGDVLIALEQVCGRLDDTEDAVGRQIELLQEHRQALITAAVTGQLDVPGAV